MEEVLDFLAVYMSYGIMSVSLTASYCLSNNRVTLGRYLGCCSASLFMSYGFITMQPAFIFGEMMFLYIYITAVIKFKTKKDEYKEKSESDDETITQMEEVIHEANHIQEQIQKTREGHQSDNKILNRKQLHIKLAKLLKIGAQIETNIEE